MAPATFTQVSTLHLMDVRSMHVEPLAIDTGHRVGAVGANDGLVPKPDLSPDERPTTATYSILLAADHALLRFGLRSLLVAGADDLALHESACLSDAMATYRANPDIDLVLLDLNMTDCRGLHGVQQFMAAYPDAQVAVLSATQDEFVIKQAQALGVVAYLPKTHAPQKLSQMILSLLRSVHPSNASDATALKGFAKRGRSPSYDRVAELGPRHLEILDLVLFGCSNQEISNATGLHLGTVKNYVSIILLALDVKSRSHLISVFR